MLAEKDTWPIWMPKEFVEGGSALRRHFENFSLPLSCGMGMYYSGKSSCRPALRYVHNEVGSQDSIAGIANEAGNVFGLMPHPERASDEALGGTKGLLFLYALASNTNVKIRPNSALERFANHISPNKEVAERPYS